MKDWLELRDTEGMINADVLDTVFEEIATGKIENLVIGWIDSDNKFSVAWRSKEGTERYLSMVGLIEQLKHDFIKAYDDEN